MHNGKWRIIYLCAIDACGSSSTVWRDVRPQFSSPILSSAYMRRIYVSCLRITFTHFWCVGASKPISHIIDERRSMLLSLAILQFSNACEYSPWLPKARTLSLNSEIKQSILRVIKIPRLSVSCEWMGRILLTLLFSLWRFAQLTARIL